MNLYLRFFDREVLVKSFEEAQQWLENIPEIGHDEELLDDLYHYYSGNMPYPKRYKVPGRRAYFIAIKTDAASFEEFKANGQNNSTASMIKEGAQQAILEEREGWYQADMLIKRMITDRDSGLSLYVDSDFSACVWSMSIKDCYDKVVDYLHGLPDLDSRSQLPSVKGKNFQCRYVGTELTSE